MRNNPVLITGCQRSGTTLLNLILDSHPEVTGIDEAIFDSTKTDEYLNSSKYGKHVVWKLPQAVPHIRQLYNNIKPKIIWCLRDPRDVVASMIKLKILTQGNERVSWSFHPYGGQHELASCVPHLEMEIKDSLERYLGRYEFARNGPQASRTHSDAVIASALCWRAKNEFLKMLEKENISHSIVKYEDLITEPRHTIEGVIEHIGIPWSDNLLNHHRLHSGYSVGKTDNTRPIDKNNRNKWKHSLTNDDLEIIQDICGTLAGEYDYNIL
ncbi:MAG: sulfotransferase [Thiotrichaceae bacterium]